MGNATILSLHQHASSAPMPEKPHPTSSEKERTGGDQKEAGEESREEDRGLNREDLLKHYVQESVQVLQGLDNLGNFLMGFGVIMLGYLLNAPLKLHFVQLFARNKGHISLLSGICLFAWITAVLFLLRFMYWFLFHLLAGRTVHATRNKANTIGQRIRVKRMTYRKFSQQAPDFDTFVAQSYLEDDQQSPQQLWYATFRYARYMAFCKLMVMNRMRTLLAWALAWGVLFKLTEIGLRLL